MENETFTGNNYTYCNLKPIYHLQGIKDICLILNVSFIPVPVFVVEFGNIIPDPDGFSLSGAYLYEIEVCLPTVAGPGRDESVPVALLLRRVHRGQVFPHHARLKIQKIYCTGPELNRFFRRTFRYRYWYTMLWIRIRNFCRIRIRNSRVPDPGIYPKMNVNIPGKQKPSKKEVISLF
jgi:hypothetical protein